MNKKIINKILSGVSDNNIRFNDLRKLLLSLNFIERINGDHHILTRTNVEEIINIQPLKDGKAKAYQVKQVRRLFVKYKLLKEIKNAS